MAVMYYAQLVSPGISVCHCVSLDRSLLAAAVRRRMQEATAGEQQTQRWRSRYDVVCLAHAAGSQFRSNMDAQVLLGSR
jgi:hypothetical protein